MDTDSKNNGLTFSTVLFFIFLVLKLCGIINWPWILVFAPIWIPLAIAVFFITIMFLIERFLNK